jgi:hypothetical protein
MLAPLIVSQKTSGVQVHPIKFFEKDSRAYLTGELTAMSFYRSYNDDSGIS